MIVPPVGGLGGLSLSNIGGLAQSGEVGQGLPAGQSEPALGGAAGAGPSGGFGNALTGAISSLEQTQQSADNAAQALATGTRQRSPRAPS